VCRTVLDGTHHFHGHRTNTPLEREQWIAKKVTEHATTSSSSHSNIAMCGLRSAPPTMSESILRRCSDGTPSPPASPAGPGRNHPNLLKTQTPPAAWLMVATGRDRSTFNSDPSHRSHCALAEGAVRPSPRVALASSRPLAFRVRSVSIQSKDKCAPPRPPGLGMYYAGEPDRSTHDRPRSGPGDSASLSTLPPPSYVSIDVDNNVRCPPSSIVPRSEDGERTRKRGVRPDRC
jgi:hypothetical protein